MPKADLHLHQEVLPRLDRIVARQTGREQYDWRIHLPPVTDRTPPGFGRVGAMSALDRELEVDPVLADDPETFVLMMVDILKDIGLLIVAVPGRNSWENSSCGVRKGASVRRRRRSRGACR